MNEINEMATFANNKKTIAADIRERILKNGIEIIDQVEKLALTGDESYDGNEKALHLMVKLITPMLSLKDDKVKITKEARQTYEDRLVELAMQGEISVTIAQEYLTVITKATEIGDLREVIEKLNQLELKESK